MDAEHPMITMRRMAGARKPDEVVKYEGQLVPVHRFTESEAGEVRAQELRFAASVAEADLEPFVTGWLLGRLHEAKARSQAVPSKRGRLVADVQTPIPSELYGTEFAERVARTADAVVQVSAPVEGRTFVWLSMVERVRDGG